MGSKANPAAIGAFVIGAIALAVIGLVVFGSGQMFKQTSRAVCFFSGDVNGLSVGAPVKFKGVEIGRVAEIRLRLKGEQNELSSATMAAGIRIPVVIEVDDDKLIQEGGKSLLDPARLKQLIGFGLRAQLVSQSLVTGLLLVQLDFLPDSPATFVLPPGASIEEIPTVPTSIEQVQSAAQAILRELEEVHFNELVKTATETLSKIKEVVASPGLQQALADLPEAVADARQAVIAVRDLAARLDSGQGPLLQSLRSTSDKAGVAMDGAQATMEKLQAVTSPEAPVMVDLAASLREIAAAARSLRLLTDYLERHPSSVVRGRYEGDEK